MRIRSSIVTEKLPFFGLRISDPWLQGCSLWILFLLAVVIACREGKRGEEPSSAFAIALWSEFSPPERVRTALPLLKAHSLGIYQAVHTEKLADPSYRDALKELLRESVRSGLDTRAWILLPYTQGYWPNEENRRAFMEEADRVMEWFQKEGIPVTWIVVDMEPSYHMTQTLLDTATSRDLKGLLSTFLA